MFRTKKGPGRPFTHAEDCKILLADPDVRIPWSEIERGHWTAVCQCGEQHYYAPAPARVQVDPRDPAVARHAPECGYVNEDDPSVLRILLRVVDTEDGRLVTCSACECLWTVPFYGERRGR